MVENYWQDKYPAGVSSEININEYRNIQSVLKESCNKFADKPAFSNFDHELTYKELYELSENFASYLQHFTELQVGDRVAIQMPNILQYPIVIFGAIRAGLVVVNTNPLYTKSELEHQFNDSGATALICLDSVAHLAEQVIPKTNIKTVIVTKLGDRLPIIKRLLVNFSVKHIKKMVPTYHLPQAFDFNKSLLLGATKQLNEVDSNPQDVAILQYTGGTTGVAKGAMLSHKNLIANMLQVKGLMGSNLNEGCEISVAPLPLYHIYAFTFHCMVMMLIGAHNILITNPRDVSGLIKDISKHKFTIFTGLNTLFLGLSGHSQFKKVDFSALKLTISGGMALQKTTAQQWENITQSAICEGYGMTEASPIVAVNPYNAIRLGSIGLPLPSTLCKMIDEEGNTLDIGVAGELCVKGPQVMLGYWQNQQANEEIFTEDGWLRTGDIGCIHEDGYLQIIDRKKDMIVVSGFNVYPNELENIVAMLEQVTQCAVIGLPHEKTGEVIKLFVVVKPEFQLSQEQIVSHMRAYLTAYKIPKLIEFRDNLPTSNVGKVLRRELRNSEISS
ncbi:UNVERIFIED_CONTAM: hypothetical protein GTU68_010967 [Idotea baltica]|nr:hypothetical protein [Idotea baltica]